MSYSTILAIESSCDETSAAVIENGTTILSNVIASSSSMHEKYGGIVPEVAAREQLKYILPVIQEALDPFTHELSPINYQLIIEKHIDAIAVTVGPGLIGSLLIGVEAAKTLAYATGKPLIPVNHVLAHIYANFLTCEPSTMNCELITYPAIALVVSGGHTELFLMKSQKDLQWLGGTIDDAAGEAFDKTARLLGFGARGGLAIQESAAQCKMLKATCQIHLPRPMIHDGTLNFSFSGLKTAIVREVRRLQSENTWNEETISQLSFEVQETITDVLVKKTMNAVKQYDAKAIMLGGGVSANTRLREKFQTAVNSELSTVNFFSPPIALCTDNAAYIGSYAFFRGKPEDWHTVNAIPDLSVEV